jgi:antitoxin VapB
VYIGMTLHIRDPEADRLARELAALPVSRSPASWSRPCRDKLKRGQGRTTFPGLKDEIMTISRQAAALPRRTRAPTRVSATTSAVCPR